MSNQFPGWRHEPTRPFPPGVVPPVVNMKVLKLEDLWKLILKKTTKLDGTIIFQLYHHVNKVIYLIRK